MSRGVVVVWSPVHTQYLNGGSEDENRRTRKGAATSKHHWLGTFLMTMEHHATNRPLNAEDALAITLLSVCEVVKNVLTDRCPPANKKRLYWLDRLDRDIEAVNRTFDGYLPGDFIEASTEYHAAIELAVNNLMRRFRG